MRRNRIILVVLWITSVVCISFYGGTVSYGFFTVVSLIPVVSLIYLLLVLLRFKIYQRFECPEIVSNHVVPFYFTLQNEDFFAFAGVRVNFYSDFSEIDGLSDDIEYELLPHTKIRKETGLLCRYRGEYDVGIKSVTLRDFFGLFSITYSNREPLRASVVPDIIKPASLKSTDAEAFSSRESAYDMHYPNVTVREYMRGDDVRRINWKQSARTGKLYVRNYAGEEKDGVGIIIDTRRKDNEQAVYLPVENRILEAAIALALFFMNKNIHVSAYCYKSGVEEHAVDSADSFDRFYRSMASAVFDPDLDSALMYAAFMGYAGIGENKIVFMVTPDADDGAMELAGWLNRGNTDVIIYHVGNDDAGDTEGLEPEVSVGPHTKLYKVPTEGNLEGLL